MDGGLVSDGVFGGGVVTWVAALVIFAAGYLLGRSQSRGDPSRLGRRRKRDRADNTVVRRPAPAREQGAQYSRVTPAADVSAEVRNLLAAGRTIEAIKVLRRANPDLTLEAATRAVRQQMQRGG